MAVEIMTLDIRHELVLTLHIILRLFHCLTHISNLLPLNMFLLEGTMFLV